MSNCFHCGNVCEEEIQYDEKLFCCEGCRTVYEILKEGNLENYYQIENERTGLTAQSHLVGKYDYLELPECREQLIIFQEKNTIKIKLFLPQIHCSSCLWLLERLHKLRKGIVNSQVFFAKKEAEITFNENEIKLKEVAELLATIGYPPSISLKDTEKKKIDTSNRNLLYKIGIAGFCFGNVMLLSFPEYLGINENDKNFQTVFNYLNLALSIPVLFYGANDYIISAFKSLRIKKVNIDVPITIGIFALYLRSLYEVIFQVGAGYFDSFIGLIFFLLLGKWFQQRTYQALDFERDYKSYFPIAVTKINETQEEIIPLKQVQVGDIIRIRNQELIPADAELVEGNGSIDYSFVTGETLPVSKYVGNKIFAGGRQNGETIDIKISKKIENSYLTQLWNNPIFDKNKKADTLTDHISKKFTLFLLLIAVVSLVSWLFIEPSKAPFVFVSILIVACPCAIALSVPFTYGNGMRILGRNDLYLKSIHVMEPLCKASDIVFDKTGTITENNLSSIRWEGRLSDTLMEEIHHLVKNSSHPLSRKIHAFINSSSLLEIESYNELAGKGIIGKVNGKEYKIGNKDWLNITEIKDPKTRVCVVVDNEFIGSFVIENTYRKGIENLFNKLSKNHKLHILSGDNESEYEKLKEILPENTEIHFHQKPEDKLHYIENLQKQGKKVMMLGDGLNDAGALQQADLGVSVVDDLYSFTPSSDIIINGKKLAQFDKYIQFAKFNMTTVKLSYMLSFLYNSVGLSFAISGKLEPIVAAILMPLSSITVVLFVSLLTNLKGRGLG